LTDEATTLEFERPVAIGLGMRMAHGLRRPHNWLQLLRFGVVGASGYVVNLGVYALLVRGLEVEYHLAAVAAFAVALANNFVWNRRWTFDARAGARRFQAPRFLVVSLLAFGASLGVLDALVELAGASKLLAQAVAILAATPLNFLGNKLWSFRG
jgi:dolichol-phosphate mannosyltransferase